MEWVLKDFSMGKRMLAIMTRIGQTAKVNIIGQMEIIIKDSFQMD